MAALRATNTQSRMQITEYSDEILEQETASATTNLLQIHFKMERKNSQSVLKKDNYMIKADIQCK